MAFTTPATATAGTVLTASFLNTYLRDNVAWMATDSPTCRAYNNANISITTSATPQALTFNSERFDNASLHSTSVNTNRITIPSGGGGKYVIGGGLSWASSAAGTYRNGYFQANGTTIFAVATGIPGAATNAQITPCTIYSLTAADYIEFYAQQDSGGALNALNAGSYSPEFWAIWNRT